MKPKLLTAILLFVSAYTPLFIILAVKDFDFALTHRFKHSIPIYILLSFCVISIALLFFSVSSIKRGNMPVKIRSIKSRSVDLINYTIPYIVSFFGFDLSKIEDVVSLIIFLCLMLLLTIKSKSVFMNPILLLAGYNLYDLEYEFDGKTNSTIVISKHDMRCGEVYYIRSLTRFLYFVTEKEK
ncbi:hypothetical protein [Ferruginibacter sp. SUN106]|uniref:hypothetical protein n=1 Tax=Ferruginibacter sp. SUN106 TaxID=2978348 RepID=UPI003D36D16A